MTTQLDQRKMQITVKGAMLTSDRNGNPQWEVQAADPFSSNPDYVTKYWIPAKNGETGPPPAVYWCILTRGQLKTAPEGKEAYGGHLDWMWRWRIASRADFNAPDAPEPPRLERIAPPAQAQSNGVPSQAPAPAQYDVTRNSIERQVVFKASVDLTVAFMSDPGADPDLRPRDVLLEWTEYLWPILQSIGLPADQGNAETAPDMNVGEPPANVPDGDETVSLTLPW
jgi:hypothetical protein